MKKIAVILCGSGFKDGSEIRESVAVLLGLSRAGAETACFAPDLPQFDVINCLTGQAIPGEKRNMLIEAARIARGKICPLQELRPDDFDGLILPGGFGVAKNLCTWAHEGADGRVLPDLQKIIEAFHGTRKPIGAVCIAPAVLALALRKHPLELTLGQSCEDSAEIEKMGHRHIRLPSSACHVDEKNRIVSTPAYMNGSAPLHEVFEGIERLVNAVLALT